MGTLILELVLDNQTEVFERTYEWIEFVRFLFSSESVWTFEAIWDSSDHSIKNMIC